MPLPTFDLKAELEKPYRAVVFGPPGNWKTSGALTFPRPNIIDFDEGMVVGNHPQFVAKWGHKVFKGKPFTETNLDGRGVPKLAKAFDDACLYVEESMKLENVDEFDTWIVDSGTSMSRAAMFKSILLMKGGGLGITSNTLAAAEKSGVIVPKQQDYGAARGLVEQFISMLKDTGKMMVFICHEYTETDEQGNTTGILPLLVGGSREAIPAMFHEVYYISVEGVGSGRKAVAVTEKTGHYIVKSRLGIPTKTEWNWPAIEAELNKRKAQ
jgi:hypothetical protein